jgi:dTDP-4-dehydrorhamnose reductase
VKLLVTGGAGYLGSEVCRQALERGVDVLATQLVTPVQHGKPLRLDVRDEAETAQAFLRHRPDTVIHTAYRLAGPELESAVVKGSRSVALNARRCGARLVHLSTDLVFDGEHGAPYTEDSETRPVSAYGIAKAQAEEHVRRLHPEALVVRTSLLYGKAEPGPQEKLAFSDVAFYVDEIRCPTVVGELAAALLELAPLEVHGLLHVAAAAAVSRYELARLLRAAHGQDPETVRGAPSPPSGRARNVALDSSRAAELLPAPLRGVHEILGAR